MPENVGVHRKNISTQCSNPFTSTTCTTIYAQIPITICKTNPTKINRKVLNH